MMRSATGSTTSRFRCEATSVNSASMFDRQSIAPTRRFYRQLHFTTRPKMLISEGDPRPARQKHVSHRMFCVSQSSALKPIHFDLIAEALFHNYDRFLFD